MYTFESRVRYSEVDSEHKLTLPALLDYLQDCCTFQSEALHVGLDYLEREKVGWVLSSWEVEILRYPDMGETIRVHTWPYAFNGFYGYRNFLVEDAQGGVLARANSVWVFMDMARMRPTKVTEVCLRAYEGEFGEPLDGAWGDRKVAVPELAVPQTPVSVARFHIDTNHHMNNGKYVLVAEEYLPDGFEVGGLRVEYKKAAKLGDVLFPRVTEEGDLATVVLAQETGKPYAVVRFARREKREAEG